MIGIGSVRFLLALAVLFLHADFVAFEVAQIAVLTFFFISGFLMQRAFLSYSSPWRFLVNRALRLIPAFLIVAALTWSIIAVSNEDFRRAFGFIYLRGAVSHGGVPPLNSLGSVETDWSLPYFGFDSELVPQAWSIGNELVYYLTVPILALLGLRWLYLLLAGSIAFLVWQLLSRLDDFDYSIYTNTLATFAFFLLGYLISRSTARLAPPRERRQSVARWSVIALITLSYFLDFPDSISPLLVIGYSLLLISLILSGLLLSMAGGVSARASEGKISRWLGRISYPLYLSHMVTIGLLNNHSLLNPLTALLASTLLAWALLILVDDPIERVRIRLRKSQSR